MADSDLKIQVTTTADLSGLKDVQAQIDETVKHTQGLKEGADAATKGFELTRFEAASLANEFIRGETNARALGQSLAEFGNPIAIAGVALFGVYKLITDSQAAAAKLVEESAKQNEELVKMAQNWLRVAEAVKDAADMASLTGSFGTALDDISKKINELTRKAADVSGLRRGLQELFSTQQHVDWLKNLIGPDADKQLEALKKIREEMLLIQGAAGQKAQEAETVSELQKQSAFRAQIAQYAATALATGDDELKIQEQVNGVIKETHDEAIKLGLTEEQATEQANIKGEALRHQLETTRGMAPAQRDYNQSLHDAEIILQGIRQQQTLIAGAPFMGADAKQAALLASYNSELEQVKANMLALQKDVAGGALDPARLEQDNQKLQQLGFTVQQLGQKISAATHPLQADLQNWANSFGSTATQISHTIEGTINASLQSLNTYLVTGKFNAQALLQQIETLGLQLLEQMAIQRVMAAINSSAAVTQATATGPIIAAAYAPAATSVTIATEGQAALSAPAEYAAALLAIQAMAVAHEGGAIGDLLRLHSGGLAPDEVPIIAQEGEFMIQRNVAQQAGMMDFLSGLNEGAFHSGGRIRRMHRGGGGESFRDTGLIDTGPSAPRFGFTPPDLPDITDPNVTGGPSRRQLIESMYPDLADEYTPHELNSMTQLMINMGYLPQFGTPGFGQGPTMSPTTFDPQGYPYAISVSTPDVNVNPPGLYHSGVLRKPSHSGGPIRLHSGGSTGGGGRAGGALGAPQVHVYPVMERKEILKHVASREGHKIIFDAVSGRRIDLGLR